MIMRIVAAGLMGALMLTAWIATGSSPQPGGNFGSCELFREYPEYHDQNASVAKLTVVTLNDGDAFCRLLRLTSKHPLEGKPPVVWCGYEGFDEEFHYASALKFPGEIYRVRRTLVNQERLVRTFTRGEPEDQEERGTTISWPVSTIASEWLNRADLDRSLIPVDPSDVPQ
jgi:hypothetical protein